MLGLSLFKILFLFSKVWCVFPENLAIIFKFRQIKFPIFLPTVQTTSQKLTIFSIL